MKSHGWNATITDKSFEYDGLADLKERNGRRIRSVSVVGRPSDSEDTYGQVEVAFEDGRVRLDRSFTTVPSDSLWLALVGRFTRREPHFLFTFLPPLVVLLALYLFYLALLLSRVARYGTWVSAPVALVAIGLFVNGSVGLVRGARGRWVILERRHEAGFWARKGDEVVTNLFVLAVGWLLGFLTSLVT